METRLTPRRSDRLLGQTIQGSEAQPDTDGAEADDAQSIAGHDAVRASQRRAYPYKGRHTQRGTAPIQCRGIERKAQVIKGCVGNKQRAIECKTTGHKAAEKHNHLPCFSLRSECIRNQVGSERE